MISAICCNTSHFVTKYSIITVLQTWPISYADPLLMDFAASFPGYSRKQVGIFSAVFSARLTYCPHLSNIFFFCFAYFVPNFGCLIMMCYREAYLNQGGWHIWSHHPNNENSSALHEEHWMLSQSRYLLPKFSISCTVAPLFVGGLPWHQRAGVTHNLKEGNALCRVMSLKILKYKAERSSSRSDLCSAGKGTSQS